jgi:mRNA-degrading endonuclease toxin of MazEF toxin-antitoxin module
MKEKIILIGGGGHWNLARGSEQAGKRPALVIQNDIGNEKASTTVVAAISGSVKILSYERQN